MKKPRAMKTNNDLFLLSPGDITSTNNWHLVDPALIPYFILTLWWSENFLTRPNKDLGRSGSTCPYVRPAMDKSLFWLTAIERGKLVDGEQGFLENRLLKYRDWLLNLEPSGEDGSLKTILILLPGMTENEYGILDDIQGKLKGEFLKHGLMIGQFHPNCEEPGIHNIEFRPLKSPVPLLAIRKITPGDVVFMKTESGRYHAEFLGLYFGAIAKKLPKFFVDEIVSSMCLTNNQ